MPLPPDIRNAVAGLPEVLREPATLWLERITADRPLPAGADAAAITRVVALSDFAAGILLREPEWFTARYTRLDGPHDSGALDTFVNRIADCDDEPEVVKQRLRQERNRQLFSIFWRETTGSAAVEDTLAALSDVADRMLSAAAAYSERRLARRFGVLRDGEGRRVPLLVIGMGKLGGRELNFSSDIDIIFTYPANGESDGDRVLEAQPYFERLARGVVDLLDEVTEDGFVFRTDTRLRPFGDSGPPVISFTALESYLQQHGRTWERYAYVKARAVGPPVPLAVRETLFEGLIKPFVYRRYLDFGVFEALRDLHGRIAAEGSRRELESSVKLGPGGIREIEFIVQSLQLVRGGSRPDLQTPSLLDVLPRLSGDRGLPPTTVAELRDAYCLLRRVENFIQAMRDQQTHDLPNSPVDRARLCLALGYKEVRKFDEAVAETRARVRHHFDAIALRAPASIDRPPATLDFERLWRDNADAAAWQSALAAAGHEAAAGIAATLSAFRGSTAIARLGGTAADRLRLFVPRLLAIARDCQDPARAVTRAFFVLDSVLRRSAYLALLNENRDAAERFVRLCADSAYITAELARYPVLLDELLDPVVLTAPMRRDELNRQLDELLAQRPGADSEERMEVLARFQRATMFRIAVADFSGGLQLMQVSDALTWLAEAVIERALAVAWDELVERHGRPGYRIGGKRQTAGFGVAAYGKLGGLELSYGSDLDIVFLHDSRGADQETDGAKPIDNATFFGRLVRRLVHFLSTRTTTGAMYEIDTRLRPSGRKGLLVSSTEAFLRYQEDNAWTWEHQALLRARPVAGSDRVAAAFAEIRDETLKHRVRRDSLRADVLDMRRRMRRELDDSDESYFSLKHGEGGIGDIEFIVQYLVLDNAASHPSVIEFTDNVRQLNALAECGALPLPVAAELQEIYRAYRMRQHRLALDDEPSRVPAGEFRDERARVNACWASVFGT
jgi:glutamate-ammonia-ligase adenylyltransferase